MNWDFNHSESERFASAAEIAAKEGNKIRSVELYRLAAEAERRALDDIDLTKARTFGITLVSTVALYYKAGEYLIAQDIALKWLAEDNIPTFARDQLSKIIEAINSTPYPKLELINNNDVPISSAIKKLSESQSDYSSIHNLATLSLRPTDDEIGKQLYEDYKDARKQAKNQYIVSLFISVISTLSVIFGLLFAIKGSMSVGIASAISGVAIALINFSFFSRLDYMHRRIDRYHEEFLAIKKLGDLLAACDQISDEKSKQLYITNVIQAATESSRKAS